MVYVTRIRLTGGTYHEHISDVMWRNSATGETGQSTKAAMVHYIDSGARAQVTDGRNTVDVGVVRASSPYIRTYADGKWTDNLLALPRF
jgi:hypothetical protein